MTVYMTVFRAVSWARELCDDEACPLSWQARALLKDLCGRLNDDAECWPSVETLATALSVHAGTIRKARAELVDAGLVAAYFNGGRGHPNRYRVLVPGAVIVHPSARKPTPPARVNGKTRADGAGLNIPNPRPQRGFDVPNPRQRRRDISPTRAETRAETRATDEPEELEEVEELRTPCGNNGDGHANEHSGVAEFEVPRMMWEVSG